MRPRISTGNNPAADAAVLNQTEVVFEQSQRSFSFPNPVLTGLIREALLSFSKSSTPATEDIFLRNYAQKRLQVFASASSSDNGKKHQDGPVIICLDTSNSMTGDPWVVASALTMAVTIMAKRRHRKVLVVRYSFNHDLFEVKSLRSQRKEFGVYLSHALNGGNDEDSMFKWLFSEVLPSMDSFSSADVLCISDFGWITVSDEVFEMISANKASGMKFYGLDTTGEGKNGFSCLSQAEHMPDSIIDSMWLWDQKSCSCREKL